MTRFQEHVSDYTTIFIVGMIVLIVAVIGNAGLSTDKKARPLSVVVTTTAVPQINTLPPIDCLKFDNDGKVVATVC